MATPQQQTATGEPVKMGTPADQPILPQSSLHLELPSLHISEPSHTHSEMKLHPDPPYSIFSRKDRAVLIIILSLIGFWSTISLPIYFPALPVLAKHFKVSDQTINLSVLAYLIMQGISPTFASNLADTFGRRPVFILLLLIYIAACIGLSQCNVLWLLIVLRCVQGAGIAPVIAICSGVGGDVCTPRDRGGFVGVVSGMLLVGNGFGGLVGAGLISGFDWRGIFVFLAIGAGVSLISLVVFLPETNRFLVGNGSVRPPRLLLAPVLLLPHYSRRLTGDRSTRAPRKKFDVLAAFKILVELPVLFSLIPPGIQFASWTMTLTSISTVLEAAPYNYSIIHVGLIYLPQGIACLIGSVVLGRALNWYYRYRRDAFDRAREDAQVSGEKVAPFNRYRVRLDVCIAPALMMIVGLLIFGWCLQTAQPTISIIVASCLVSFASSSFMAAATTLLVDLHPERGSVSTSCMNLVRCLLAAAGVALLEKMTDALNLGGTYTLMAGLCLLSDLGLVYVVIKLTKQLRKGEEREDEERERS